ncbi:minor capsid protein [uncultured Sneathia sp.]|uniref:minor capsid protein n=1 Tax=uncultured Sneathia sp. TaxID=278067 RepID=UPI00259B65A3|nr:minor capsid protein [uncultured Sneathia sp.]
MDIQKLQKYWHDRALEEEKKVYDLTKKQIELQEKLYSEAKRKIDSTINFYTNKFMKNNHVDYIKAKELLTKDELKEFRWTLSNYINNAKKKDLPLQEYVKLQKQLTNSSLKHRIDKLEAMKHEINMQLNELARTKELMVNEHLSKVYEEQYYRNLYNNAIATNKSKYISRLNSSQIQNVVRSNWLSDGSSFSDIIWKNKEKLLNEMQKTITVGIISGKTPYSLSEDFARIMNVDKSRARVLLQTESARVRSMAEIESYNQMEVSKYQIIATLDDRTSDICQSMDMKVFDTKDYEVGVTAPPFHPNCRSTKVPYYEDSLITQGGRIARDPETGKQYTVGNISYSEWVEKYVKNPEQLKGYGQYARYKKVLGDKAPNSFDKFVDIKYNNSKEYEALKTRYKATKSYTFYKKYLNKRMPKTIDDLMSIMKNSNQYDIFKREYETIKTIKRKDWSKKYKKKVIKCYDEFKKEGIELTWHGASSATNRIGLKEITKKEIIETYNKPINYIEYDKKTNTNKNVRYYDLVRVITNEENTEVLTVVKDDKDRSQGMIRRGRWKKK